jgi:hypothetical protein
LTTKSTCQSREEDMTARSFGTYHAQNNRRR